MCIFAVLSSSSSSPHSHCSPHPHSPHCSPHSSPHPHCSPHPHSHPHCSPPCSVGAGGGLAALRLLWLHVLLVVGSLAPSLLGASPTHTHTHTDPDTTSKTHTDTARRRCPVMGALADVMRECPMRRFFVAPSPPRASTSSHKVLSSHRKPAAPVPRVLAALGRATHLLQLHFVVFWGFFVGTSHAFQSTSGGGCPLKTAFGRGTCVPSLLRAKPASLSTSSSAVSLFSSDESHPRTGHKLGLPGFRFRSLAPVLSTDTHRGWLDNQVATRRYMSLRPGTHPVGNSPSSVSEPIKHKGKRKGKGARGKRPTSSLTLEGALKSKRSEARHDLPEIVVIGVSHRHCPVEVREKLAIPEEDWNTASASLCEASSIDEAFVLSTCNRFEVYVAGKNEYEAMTDALQYLHARINGTVDQETLRKNMFVLTGEDAIFHLMRVSAGLDSMVLGEGQIQCQVKKAFTRSCNDEGGKGGVVLKRMLESAICVGKRVRSETEICKGAVSVSSAAVEFTALKMQQQAQQKQNEQVLMDQAALAESRESEVSEETVLPAKSLANSNVVVIGAGKMSRLLLVHLNSKKVRKVTVINRSPERVHLLQEEFKDMVIEYRPMQQMWAAVEEADVVYPCTSSTTPIITPNELKNCMDSRLKKRELTSVLGTSKDSEPTSADVGASPSCPITAEGDSSCNPSVPRPVLQFTPQLPLRFVDLSVPRNVHPSCGVEVPGVECFNVDDLKEVVQENTARRQGEISRAEGIIREEIVNYQRWQESLGAIPTMTRLRQKAEEMRLMELEKCTQRLAQLSPDDLQSVDRLSRGIVGKLLSGPMEHLRKAEQAAESATAVAQVQLAFHSMLKA